MGYQRGRPELADGMLLLGAIRLYRPLQAGGGLFFHPTGSPAGAGPGCGLGQRIFGRDPCWKGIFGNAGPKLGIFTLLFGGLLLALERDDLNIGVRWVREAVWREM